MTNIQILNDDIETIQRYIKLGREQFNLDIQIVKDDKKPTSSNRGFKSLSNELDHIIKNTPSSNTSKANKLQKAITGINKCIDPDKKHLTLKEAKELHYNSKSS